MQLQVKLAWHRMTPYASVQAAVGSNVRCGSVKDR